MSFAKTSAGADYNSVIQQYDSTQDKNDVYVA